MLLKPDKLSDGANSHHEVVGMHEDNYLVIGNPSTNLSGPSQAAIVLEPSIIFEYVAKSSVPTTLLKRNLLGKSRARK